MLTHKCDYCDSSGYAQQGGDAYKKRVTAFTVNHQDPKEPTPEPEPGANPKETPKTIPKTTPPKVARSVFELGSL